MSALLLVAAGTGDEAERSGGPYSAAMSGDVFAEFERAGWERAASRYEECWTDTVLFVEALLDAAAVRAGSRLLDVSCGPGFVSEAAAARGAHPSAWTWPRRWSNGLVRAVRTSRSWLAMRCGCRSLTRRLTRSR
jgi:hypothetical protein